MHYFTLLFFPYVLQGCPFQREFSYNLGLTGAPKRYGFAELPSQASPEGGYPGVDVDSNLLSRHLLPTTLKLEIPVQKILVLCF